MSKFYKKFTAVIGSRGFFWFIIALFVLESAWFALSARFPMAFDEAYHLATIQIYSHQYSPFFTKQPSGSLIYGPLIHNTSFLYHYLMSFPYRLITHFTYNLKIIVISLRFIDIGLFVWALFIFRRILLKIKDEPGLANLTLLFFIMIPIVPFLAGQINYDNLGIPLVALSLLWTIKFVEQLRTKHQLNVLTLTGAVSSALLASVVSYLFLPIIGAIGVYLAYVLIRFIQAEPKKFTNAIVHSWHKVTPFKKIILVIVFVISLGLFVESYGVNLVEFHTPIPQCNQLLSLHTCSTYSPWNRNYMDAQRQISVDFNPLRYTVSWVSGMFERMVFTINGPNGPEGYANPPPLLGISITIAVIFAGGILLFIRYGRKLLSDNPYLKFTLFVTLVFLISLWGRNYHDYLHLKQIVAVNGRYMIPITVPIIFTVGLCYKQFLKHHQNVAIGLAIVVFLGLLQGGGVISFINASDANWYWPYSQTTLNINRTTQKLIQPLIIQ